MADEDEVVVDVVHGCDGGGSNFREDWPGSVTCAVSSSRIRRIRVVHFVPLLGWPSI